MSTHPHRERLRVPPEFTRIQRFLRVIATPARLKIIYFLREKERCVCEIQYALRLPQNLVSYHLGILRDAGLVSVRRVGVNMHYRLRRTALQRNRAAFHATFGTDTPQRP